MDLMDADEVTTTSNPSEQQTAGQQLGDLRAQLAALEGPRAGRSFASGFAQRHAQRLRQRLRATRRQPPDMD